jgi:type I restriction enzyme M protein
MTQNDIVQKLWNLCDVLRDDGINYSDYVTELVLLLFIKMEYENAEAGTLQKHKLPEKCRWSDIKDKSGINLLNDYRKLLLDLGKSDDRLISAIYADAQTRLREPRHLEQLIKSIDGIDWFSAKQDGLGDMYEGLIEKNANETKSGAGQYFTPRPLIDSIIRCVKPQVREIIQDPAAGTAGFLIAADAYIKDKTDNLYDLKEKDRAFQKNKAFVGMELVPGTRRLALMNCMLHGMEGDDEGIVHLGNTLGDPGKSLPRADLILTNPPFGTAKGGGGPTRDDFTYKTGNKQLAFLQHVYRSLKPGGRAAIVVPDNVLFEAGVGTEIRRDLMHKCDLHTILRLPTGIFYAAGVKTNVLFFTRGTSKNPNQEENSTKNVWVYDLRSNMPNFGKRSPFSSAHLKPFEKVFGNDPLDISKRKEGEWSFTDKSAEKTGDNSRWHVFKREYVKNETADSLDISWIQDKDFVDSADLPEPEALAGEAMVELAEALREMDNLMRELGTYEEADVSMTMVKNVLGLECEDEY